MRLFVFLIAVLLLFLEISQVCGFSSSSTSDFIQNQKRRNQQFGTREYQNRFARSSIITSMSSSDHRINDNDNDDSASSSSFRLGYVTDVEGNYEYFKSYVARSNVLDIIHHDDKNDDNGVEDHEELHLTLRDENCYFVYGGDIVDKGPGDIRLCRSLVSLKQRYPDRVFLLVGNRDLNKLRFVAELSKADMERPIDDIPPPHWDPKAPTLRQYLESLVIRNNKYDGETSSFDMDHAVQLLNTRVERLKYMLIHTLGCPDTFEFRRQELAILRKQSKKERNCNNNEKDSSDSDNEKVTDEEVLESFLKEVQGEGGSLYDYLNHANIAAIVGNTIFVHGAIDIDTMQFVPDLNSKFENPSAKPPPGQVCTNVYEWVDALNEYLKYGLQDYLNRPYWNEIDDNDSNNDASPPYTTTTNPIPPRTTRGGECLMALQNRPAMWGRSIISNCYGDGGVITTHHAALIRNNPQRIQQSHVDPLQFEKVCSDPMDTRVSKWLIQHGIRRIVVGHKPTGDCPAVLSASYTGVEIVSADTSYSDYQPKTSKYDHRGVALSIVEIVGNNSQDNQLVVSGVLKDKQEYHNTYPRLFGKDDIDDTQGDPYLGIRLMTNKNFNDASTSDNTQQHDKKQEDQNHYWWTKASIPSKRKYHLCRGKGRNVEYKTIPISDIGHHL